MKLFIRKTARSVLGLFVFSIGVYLSITANIGLDAWSSLNMGLSGVSGLSYGNISVMVSVLIVVIDIILKEKIGVATILDAILVGKFIDLFNYIDLFPKANNFAIGVAVMLVGQVFVSVGSYFYMGAGLGCGPRDALMVAVGKRLPNIPIGLARGIIEGSALLTGWALGAKVGVGTVIAVFGISFILQYTFKLLRFDVKAVHHEDVITSIKNLITPKELV